MERLVIFVVAIFFYNRDDGTLRNKTREIVDVPIGVVAGDAVTEPENLANAQIIPQALFDFTATQLRIAVCIQETRLGGKKSACAVPVDRAPFQNHSGIKNW